MSQMILRDYKTFIKQDYGLVSLGIKPSGSPHIGSVATLVSACDYVVQHPDAKVNIQIMDLDFDSQRGNMFTPFIHRSNGHGQTFRELFRSDLEEVVTIMDNIYQGKIQGKVKIDFFSEFLLAPETLNLFLDVFKDKEKIHALNYELFDEELVNNVPVSGICPSCKTSTSRFATRIYDEKLIKKQENLISMLQTNSYKMTEERLKGAITRAQSTINEQNEILQSINLLHGGNPEYFLRSSCQNPDCSTDSYEFDLREGFYNIHYLVDPLRDEFFASQGIKTAHVFGGDYALVHGRKKIPKAERIHNGLIALGHMNQDFFIGPMVTYGDEKMGKSGKCFAFDCLDYKQQKLTVEFIHDMLEHGSRELACEDMLKRVLPASKLS